MPGITRYSTNNQLDSLLKKLKQKKLILFLDFDGTMAPVNEVPDNTFMSHCMRDTFEKLVAETSEKITTVVISGRGVRDVMARVQARVCYSGSHGVEYRLPDGTHCSTLSPKELNDLKSRVIKVKAGMHKRRLSKESGGNIEDKETSLTWHYFLVPEDKKDTLQKVARDVIEEAGFEVIDGAGCYEVRTLTVNKSHAMLEIAKKMCGEKWFESHNVLFLGDSSGDEDSFHELVKSLPDNQKSCAHFIRVKPYDIVDIEDVDTKVDIVFDDTEDVRDLLSTLISMYA